MCYPLGMTESLYETEIEESIKQGRRYWGLLPWVIYSVYSDMLLKSLVFYVLRTLVFCCIIVLASYKVKVETESYFWQDLYLFPIYILQRIPMIVQY